MDMRAEHAEHAGENVGVSERVMPVCAGVSALATLLSCLPLAIASSIGAVALSAALSPFRPWFVGLSTVLLSIAFLQVYRQPRARRQWSTAVILWVSAVFVLLVVLAEL